MASIKKRSKQTNPKPRQAVTKKSQPKQARKVAELRRELAEALEQQSATSQILRVIASSPADLQPVLDAVAESAARLCDAPSAVIQQVDGSVMRRVAAYGPYPAGLIGEEAAIDRTRISSRAIIDRQTIHVHDLVVEAETEFPGNKKNQQATGTRSAVATPLLREGVAIGVIYLRRLEVRPFTDKQIKLLETFADQAVIAIENARLFEESQNRNRVLIEALEQQTATSEILRVISSSPTELQPVLDAIAGNASRLCEAERTVIFRFDGELLRAVSTYNVSAELREFVERNPISPGRHTAAARTALERRTVHIHDVWADPEYTYRAKDVEPHGTVLGIPMLRGGDLLGVITIFRHEVRPFSEKQVELMETFADQAVIAIENVRLFQELQDRNRQLTEALEQQTATSEVLRVIASSPTKLQPVLDTLIANAVRLSGATRGHVRQYDGEFHRVVAHYGETPEMITTLRANPLRATPDLPAARALLAGKPIHILDVRSEAGVHLDLVRQMGTRTMLAVPLLRDRAPRRVPEILKADLPR